MKNKAFDNTSRILLNKTCPLSGKDSPKIDYKNINLLKRYTTEKGKYFLAELPRFLRKNKKNYLGL